MDDFQKFCNERRYTERGDLLRAYYDAVCKYEQAKEDAVALSYQVRDVLKQRDELQWEFDVLWKSAGEANARWIDRIERVGTGGEGE
jgi:hypothetical protein